MKYYFAIASHIMGLLGNKKMKKKTTTKTPNLDQLITYHYILEKVMYYSFFSLQK